jgi:hypothetical protein
VIAIAAIDWPSSARLEGDLCLFTAFGTGYGVQLAGRRRTEGGHHVPFLRLGRSAGSASGAARRAALGRVIMPFGMESLLLIGGECVSSSAIMTYQSKILEIQRGQPPLELVWRWKIQSDLSSRYGYPKPKLI